MFGSAIFRNARAPTYALFGLGIINTGALVVYLRRDKAQKNVHAISQAESNTAAVIASERFRGLRALEGGDYETAIRAFTQISMLGGGNEEITKLLRIATDLRDRPPAPIEDDEPDGALTNTETPKADDEDEDTSVAQELVHHAKTKGRPKLVLDKPKKDKRVASLRASAKGAAAADIVEQPEPAEAPAPQPVEPKPEPKPEPVAAVTPPPPPPPAPPPAKVAEPELSFAADTLVLVAHASVSVGRVSTAELRALYSGEQTELGGTKVVLSMRPYGADASARLLSRIGMPQRPFREHWSKVAHYEGRSPPRIIAELDDIARFVGSTPGALCVVLGKDLPELRGRALKYIVVSR